jgi:hypothetical protein
VAVRVAPPAADDARVFAAADALDAYLCAADLRALMDWLDGERVYAAGRGDSARAAALEEVQRELRARDLDGRDAVRRSLDAAAAVLEAVDGLPDADAAEDSR